MRVYELKSAVVGTTMHSSCRQLLDACTAGHIYSALKQSTSATTGSLHFLRSANVLLLCAQKRFSGHFLGLPVVLA